MTKILFSFLFLLMSFNTYSKKTISIAKIVDSFYAQKKMSLLKPEHPCLPPRGESCFRFACDNVGSFECDDERDMDVLRRSCRGVWGDICLKTAIKKLSRFEYDDLEEMSALARSCKGIYDNDCILYTCDKLGSFGCDDLEEIIEVNRACAGH